MVKVVPHTHSLGRSGGIQLYLRQSASRNAPLCSVNPWAVMGSAVTQLWAPFLLPSSAALCKCWGSRAFTSVATSSRFLRLSALRVVFMDCCSCPVSPRSLFCCTISAVSGAVGRSEKVCSSSIVVGFTSPKPRGELAVLGALAPCRMGCPFWSGLAETSGGWCP